MEQPPRAEIEGSMQYHHPEKMLAELPGGQEIGDELLAPFFGTDVKTYREIKDAFAERGPEDGIELVNAGISGDTTSGLLGRFLDILEASPAWIIILIGTNDVAFVRDPRTKSLVSREETHKNLLTLRDLAEALSAARLVWITPPPAIEARVVESSSPSEPTWRNADIAEVA